MYNKLFEKILDSSIWLEDHPTRIVWLTLLACMDEDGYCEFASCANLARRAIVTLEQARKAVATLEAPDPDSSDPDDEGRRLERVPGGWFVLNARKYRERVTRQEVKRQNRERAQRYRDERKNRHAIPLRNDANHAPVTGHNASITQSEAVALADVNKEESTGELALTSNDRPFEKQPGIVYLPLPGSQGEWAVPEKLFHEMVHCHPGRDVARELEKMRGWLVANTRRRRTPRGLPCFINNWLSREPIVSSSKGDSNGKLSKIEHSARTGAAAAEIADRMDPPAFLSGGVAKAGTRNGRVLEVPAGSPLV